MNDLFTFTRFLSRRVPGKRAGVASVVVSKPVVD